MVEVGATGQPRQRLSIRGVLDAILPWAQILATTFAGLAVIVSVQSLQDARRQQTRSDAGRVSWWAEPKDMNEFVIGNASSVAIRMLVVEIQAEDQTTPPFYVGVSTDLPPCTQVLVPGSQETFTDIVDGKRLVVNAVFFTNPDGSWKLRNMAAIEQIARYPVALGVTSVLERSVLKFDAMDGC